MIQPQGTYNGYEIAFQGISWQCPSLKLYGYRTERTLQTAIRKKLK